MPPESEAELYHTEIDVLSLEDIYDIREALITWQNCHLDEPVIYLRAENLRRLFAQILKAMEADRMGTPAHLRVRTPSIR